MSSYYDAYAAEYLHNNPPPKGIPILVVEYPEYPGTVFLLTYASALGLVPETRVYEFHSWINTTIKHLNSLPLLGKYAFKLDEDK